VRLTSDSLPTVAKCQIPSPAPPRKVTHRESAFPALRDNRDSTISDHGGRDVRGRNWHNSLIEGSPRLQRLARLQRVARIVESDSQPSLLPTCCPDAYALVRLMYASRSTSCSRSSNETI
jgi:hypothetical protein